MSIAVDTASPSPPYEQLRTQVAAQASSGGSRPAPGCRRSAQLAADLGMAANTVARAYRELEADGVVVTHGRRGTFVGSAALASGGDDLATSTSPLPAVPG